MGWKGEAVRMRKNKVIIDSRYSVIIYRLFNVPATILFA